VVQLVRTKFMQYLPTLDENLSVLSFYLSIKLTPSSIEVFAWLSAESGVSFGKVISTCFCGARPFTPRASPARRTDSIDSFIVICE